MFTLDYLAIQCCICHNIYDTIVQVNRGIDAILKKYYIDAPVTVKIQKKNETAKQVIRLLSNARARKEVVISQCLFCRMKQIRMTHNDVPDNMIILNSYKLKVRWKIERHMKEDLLSEPKKA